MGIEIFQIGNGVKSAQLLCESDKNYTSAILVQGHQKLNLGIVVGSQVSDILSTAGLSAASFATPLSVFSGTITLQRRMPEENESYHWREVDTWVISSAAINTGGSESITAIDDPESCQYRAGIVEGDYTAGVAHLRIGTS